MDFVRSHPFAFLAGCDAEQKPVATQIPVFIDQRDGKIFLSGHMMRKTDHHLAFANNPHVLVVFTGAHTYVSASWYADKKQASTWNYMSVHFKGLLTFLDENSLLSVLKRTTNHFEANPHSGSNFEDLPQDYIQQLSRAIIAFEIEVLEMDNVFKLSQNRDEKSYDMIMEKLEKGDDQSKIIAIEMKHRRSKLFTSK